LKNGGLQQSSYPPYACLYSYKDAKEIFDLMKAETGRIPKKRVIINPLEYNELRG
jgi:hypothetical protein